MDVKRLPQLPLTFFLGGGGAVLFDIGFLCVVLAVLELTL
jgi:hypothetical protein